MPVSVRVGVHLMAHALGCVDIHFVQMNALTRQSMDKNALGVWS